VRDSRASYVAALAGVQLVHDACGGLPQAAFSPISPHLTPSSSVESLHFSSYSNHLQSATARPIKFAPSSIPATPALTPDSGSRKVIHGLDASNNHDFVATLFPRSGLTAARMSKSVKISSPTLGTVWDGAILELPDSAAKGQTTKALYVNGKGAEHVQLRESIVALLDLADQRFQCSTFVIALDKASPALGDLLHSLMYVGGTVVSCPPFEVDPAFVLVGMEL